MAVQKRTYKFSVADCDVIDKANLEVFRQERDTWLALFEDDPAHNVRSQINELMWTDAIFRALNQMRGLGSESQPTGSHNRAIGEFIDKGFVASQVLGISKLTDPPNNDKNKNVVSLPRLLGDIKEKVHLVTRENFVCFDGLPFDYEEAARRHVNSLTPEQRRQPRWLSREGPEAFGSSKISHFSFNELCCSPAGSRLDRIDVGILTAIEGMLSHQSITKIRGFRNKYLGHAADSISRRGHSLETYGFSLDEFAEAQQRIIVAANVIGLILSSTVANPIPVPQYDVFENLDQPLMPSDQTETMMQWWDYHSESRDEWINNSLENLRKYSTSPQVS